MNSLTFTETKRTKATNLIQPGSDNPACRGKRPEEEPRPSGGAEFFRAIFENAPVGLCVSGLDARFLYVNGTLAKMLGYSAEELIGSSWTTLTHPDDVELSLGTKDQLLKEGSAFLELEKRYLHRSGAIVWVRMKIALARDSSGSPLYFVVQIEDITEHKRANEKLRESEDRFRMIADSCPSMMWATGADGTVQFFNKACRDFGGTEYTEDEGRQRHLPVHPEDAPEFAAVFNRAIKEQSNFRIEARAQRADGVWRLLGWWAKPRISPSGEFLGHIGLCADITERIQAEQARQFELSLIQSIQSETLEGILVVNQAGIIVSYNKRFLEIWKLDESQSIGPQSNSFIGSEDAALMALIFAHLEDPDFFAKRLRELSGHPDEVNHDEIRLKDGRTLEQHSTGLKNPEGMYLGRVWFFRDITAHKEAERKYRGIFDNAVIGIFQSTPDGRTLSVNPYMASIYGYDSPQEMIDLNSDIARQCYVDSTRREEFKQLLEELGCVTNFECENYRKDGSKFWVSMSAIAIRENGVVIRYEGMSQDITARMLMENALRETEQRYRGIFDNAMIGIYQGAPDGHLVSMNPAMASIFGYESPAEMIASVSDITGQLYVDPKRREQFVRTMEELGVVQHFELEVVRKDGNKIWLDIAARAVRENGVVILHEGMCEDITERKLLQEQLLQAQKLESVGQLAAGIAHEINTPTQYIGDNVRFLRDAFRDMGGLLTNYERMLAAAQANALSSETLREVEAAAKSADAPYLMEEIPKAIDQTLEGVTRVSRIVGAMREFSHPGAKEKVPTDLNHAIENTLTVARNEWKYVAEMETEFDPSLPQISCLPGEFNQVILNLIVNAAHAIGDAIKKDGSEKGKIRVQTQSCADWAEIHIQDSGTGIPEKVRNRVFDPFFTTKEIGKGTGQGLAIARSVIVDKHGGSIHFETEEGKGTTFIIRLPYDGRALGAKAVAA